MSSPGSDSPQHRIFAMLDVDGDGAITRAEYLGRVDRVAAATGRSAEHPVVAASRAAHEAVFTDMDGDGDGRVTFDEYRSWVGHDAFERSCRPALGSLFDIADADADGHLNRQEFTRLRTGAGNAETDAEAAFDALDTDGDGLVEREAYLAGIHDFVTNESSPMAVAYGGRRPVSGTRP
ncbi:EF-hand domain-containing protein [Streptomyces sp. AN091965]|uniref:EF-hand domain-containing protein n=1 Tax=Streptomyces sp. AN091965 TaxID=2927803 RepID=UPI001F612E14|nr:EF-hand domain-containing protein [Streptomyces sp. AN091965]MCI3928412.1 EF-hand domain-containing protein [Streptomyces sp. AN091965]